MGLRIGSVASGSPMILRSMRNLVGSSVITGRIFCATGLYLRVTKSARSESENDFLVVCSSMGTDKDERFVLSVPVRFVLVGDLMLNRLSETDEKAGSQAVK